MTDLLQEQITYYRARAAEYDEWFYRQGRYDLGEEFNKSWFQEAEEVRQELLKLPHQAHILELAPGTGIWTQELVNMGDRVTAIDASPEMLNINRAKVQSDKVDYIQADLFEWQPDQEVDMIFFGFWLSHVPPEKLDHFLAKVAQALKPGGIVFMVDGRRSSTPRIHSMDLGDGVLQERNLNDGRKFTIVKVYYEQDGLRAAFAKAGISATVQVTTNYLIYAQGRK